MRNFFCLAFFLLTSCATTNANYYQQTVRGWQGGTATELVKRWGNPDAKQAGLNGTTIYVYKTESYRSYDTSMGPGVGVTFTAGGHPVMTTVPNTNFAISRGANSLTCLAMFVANAKRTIIETETRGNGCHGSERFAEKHSNPNAKVQ